MKKTSIAFAAAVACMPLPALAGGPHGGGGYYYGGYRGGYGNGYRGGCGFGCGVGAGILGGGILDGALAAPYYYQPYYPPAQPYVWYYCDAAGAYYPYVQFLPLGLPAGGTAVSWHERVAYVLGIAVGVVMSGDLPWFDKIVYLARTGIGLCETHEKELM